MAKAINSNGVTISVSAGSPTAYLRIGNVTAIKGPGGSGKAINVTNLNSAAHEKLMGLPSSSVSLSINYDPDNATHVILRNARRNRTRLEFQIQLTDTVNTLLTFAGYVLAFAMDSAVGQQVRASLTIEVTGATTDGFVPPPLVYAAFDPAAKSSYITLSNNDLTATCPSPTGYENVVGTQYKSTGKLYCELTWNDYVTGGVLGIAPSTDLLTGLPGWSVGSQGAYAYDGSGANGHKNHGGTQPLYGTNWASAGNDTIISMLFDADAGTLEFKNDNISQGVAFTSITGAYRPIVMINNTTGSQVAATINFGATAFAYTPPAGYTGWTV